jgi:hypothetical protein
VFYSRFGELRPKIKENISGVLLALRRIEASEDKREYNMYSIGTGKDWFAHRVQEWQLALRRIEASKKKREYNMYVQKPVKLYIIEYHMPSFCPGLPTIES